MSSNMSSVSFLITTSSTTLTDFQQGSCYLVTPAWFVLDVVVAIGVWTLDSTLGEQFLLIIVRVNKRPHVCESMDAVLVWKCPR